MTRRTTRTHAPATLEKQAIGFTIGLYTFIILTLLALHYLAPAAATNRQHRTASTQRHLHARHAHQRVSQHMNTTHTPTTPHVPAPAAWVPVSSADETALRELHEHDHIDFTANTTHARHTPHTDYLPVTLDCTPPERGASPGTTIRRTLIFALQPHKLVTLLPSDTTPLFDENTTHTAAQAAHPTHAMLTLLRSLTRHVERTTEHSMRELDNMNNEIDDAITGYDPNGIPLGVSDMRMLLTRMNDIHETLAHAQESLFQITRATQHLLNLTPADPTHTSGPHTTHIERSTHEIANVQQYASHAHERMSAMQQSITAMLEVKQHEIVKVFTIITAVFLPPTLIATFYGMNFENMPALATQHGFLITSLVTFIAAVIPLWYIKRKGWLR